MRSWRPDVVQFEYRIMGQYLAAVAGVPRLLVDLDPASSDGHPSRLLAPLETRAWAALGRAVSRRVDSLVVLTEQDRCTITRLSPTAPLTCIPIGYDVPERPLHPAGTGKDEIVYVGSFIHPPNVDAAAWLAREIFLRVRSRVPTATLQLIGSHASHEVEALAGDGVGVHGDVPAVLPFLDAAAVFAAPIRTGGGMRVKVLEALAYGKAVVATPLAVEGLDVTDGEQVLVAETEAAFADALVALLRDPERRTALEMAARAWAEQHLDLTAPVRAYEQLYESLAGERRGRLQRPSTV